MILRQVFLGRSDGEYGGEVRVTVSDATDNDPHEGFVDVTVYTKTRAGRWKELESVAIPQTVLGNVIAALTKIANEAG